MKLATLIFLSSIMMLTACSSIFDDSDKEELPFEGKLLLDITIPNFSPTFPVRSGLIHIKTQQIYGCSAYEIEYLATIGMNEILVSISNRFIVPRTSCNDLLGPANAFIPINVDPDNYLLTLRIGSYVDHYSIKREVNKYSLLVLNTSFSALLDADQP